MEGGDYAAHLERSRESKRRWRARVRAGQVDAKLRHDHERILERILAIPPRPLEEPGE